MAITGISSYDGKQIIAAGAQSAISAGIASNLDFKDEYGTLITLYPGDGQLYSGGFIVGSLVGDKGISISPNAMGFYNSTGDVATITSGKVTAWDSLSSNKQDKLTFGYTDDQISQINGSGIYSQGGGGVVTSTAGDGTYVTAINETPLSGAGGTQLVTSIHTAEYGVMAGTSATAVDRINGLGLFAQSGWSAVNAGWAKSATYASNGVSLTNIYNSAGSGYRAFTALTGTSGYAHYYQGGMANWWNSTASNPLCIKINTANFCTAGSVSDAHLFLKQLFGPESAYTATMKIMNYKTDAQWTTKEIATFGGGVYDQSHTINPQYLLWNGNIVFNAWHGGWNQSITGVFLGGTWTSTGQELMLNITGIVSK